MTIISEILIFFTMVMILYGVIICIKLVESILRNEHIYPELLTENKNTLPLIQDFSVLTRSIIVSTNALIIILNIISIIGATTTLAFSVYKIFVFNRTPTPTELPSPIPSIISQISTQLPIATPTIPLLTPTRLLPTISGSIEISSPTPNNNGFTDQITSISIIDATPTSSPTVLPRQTPTFVSTRNPLPPMNEDYERQTIILINQRRGENGCSVELRYSSQLTAAARRHSYDMVNNNFYNVKGSDGTSVQDWAKEAGYFNVGGKRVRVNIGVALTPTDIVQGLIDTEITRVQVLDCSFNDIGVGYVEGNNGDHFWTVLVGLR